jgi:glycosyltransferase involved in cell wall biosynthesis
MLESKKKNILYVEQNTDGTIGGSHYSLLFLIEGLNREKYKPVVVFYQAHSLIDRYEKAGCKIIIMKKSIPLNIMQLYPQIKMLGNKKIEKQVIVAPLLMLQKTVNYFKSFIYQAYKCWTVLKREEIDIVHLNNTVKSPQEWILAALLRRKKIIAHERGINNVFQIQTKYWARHLKAIICISDAVEKNLLSHGFERQKLFRIYNGLSPSKFVVKRDVADVLKELNIRGSSPIVGIVGNIKEWKGQEVVIKSMRNVRDKYPDIRCLIIGDVAERDVNYKCRIYNIVKEEKLEDCVIFTGHRSDVPDIINCLDVLIHASIYPEPFGRTLLEGMALRKPIISTKIGAPLEIVADGETGILVEPGNAHELANAIIKILSDKSMAIRMGENGYKRMLEKFSLDRNVYKTQNIYEMILSS